MFCGRCYVQVRHTELSWMMKTMLDVLLYYFGAAAACEWLCKKCGVLALQPTSETLFSRRASQSCAITFGNTWGTRLFAVLLWDQMKMFTPRINPYTPADCCLKALSTRCFYWSRIQIFWRQNRNIHNTTMCRVVFPHVVQQQGWNRPIAVTWHWSVLTTFLYLYEYVLVISGYIRLIMYQLWVLVGFDHFHDRHIPPLFRIDYRFLWSEGGNNA